MPLKPETSHRAKCRAILATPQTQYSFSRLSENYVRRESILKVRIMKLWSKRDVGIFWSQFFFLRGGTCCSVAQQTRGMPGPIKDGMHWWPGLDKSFPKVVTLQTKRENENTQLRSTLFSRSSERHHGWDEIDEKFESPTIYFLKFHPRKYYSYIDEIWIWKIVRKPLGF